MPDIEFFFDFTSPYSFLAMTQLPSIAAHTGARIEPRPMLLGAVFKGAGNRAPAEVPAKVPYMFNDLMAWADLYGVKMAIPESFPINSVKAGRLVLAAESGDAWKLVDRIFRAYWSEGADIREPEVLERLAGDVGLNGAALLARTEEQALKDRLRANGDDAVARGAFGAPTFFVNGQMFVGNDRLQFVERAARGERIYR